MSATTEALELVKLLKPKIGEQAATKLIDYADKGKERTVNLQWIAIAILAAGLFAIFGILWQMSQKVATKEDMNQRFDKIEIEQREQRKLLLQILQKR